MTFAKIGFRTTTGPNHVSGRARYSGKTLLGSRASWSSTKATIVTDYLNAVKKLAQNYRSWARNNADEKPDISARQFGYADNLDAIITEVESARVRLRAVSNAFGDLSDLPPEVLAELSVTKLDELEQQMRDIVASGDEVGLDNVIIELYRRHKVVHPRRFVMNKLYRMAQKGLITGVDGKKGVYTTLSPSIHRPSLFDDDLNDDVPF